MNLHVPQSESAKAELKLLMSPENNFCNPVDGHVNFPLVQDGLLGVYLLSKEKLQKDSCMNLCCAVENGIELWGMIENPLLGLSLISAIICRRTGKNFYYSNKELLIENGQIQKAKSISKVSLGASRSGLLKKVYLEYGGEKALCLVNDLQKVAHAFLEMRGFSVGISDCFMGCEQKVKKIKKYSNKDSVRNQVCLEISKCTGKENAFRQMCDAGSKGGIVNMAQIGGVLGTQRSTFKKKDGTDFASGNFLNGLNPQDFFLHAGSGRVGLISTAIRTAMVGYTSRQMMHALNNIVRCHDGTIRSKSKAWRVVQFKYGDDDLDPERMECTSLAFLEKEAKKASDSWAVSFCHFVKKRYGMRHIE